MTQPRVRYKTHQPASAEIARLKNDPQFVTETCKLQFAESIADYLVERFPTPKTVSTKVPYSKRQELSWLHAKKWLALRMTTILQKNDKAAGRPSNWTPQQVTVDEVDAILSCEDELPIRTTVLVAMALGQQLQVRFVPVEGKKASKGKTIGETDPDLIKNIHPTWKHP